MRTTPAGADGGPGGGGVPAPGARRAGNLGGQGSIGRWLLRLLARALAAPGWLLAPYPMWSGVEDNPLEDELALLCDAMWSAQRRARTRGAVVRMLQLARAMGGSVLASSAIPWDRLATVYVARRVDRPLDAWRRRVLPATVKSELSMLAEATRRDSSSGACPLVPPYLGARARAYLAYRGAFERPAHTRSLPITAYDLWLARLAVPPHLAQAFAACVVSSFFAFRGRFVLRVQGEDFRVCPPEPIHLLPPHFGAVPVVEIHWTRRTKTKRGDQAQGPEAPIAAPQFCRVQNAFLWQYFQSLPRKGPLFPGLTVARLVELLAWLVPSPPAGYRRVLHGIRAGTATVLTALGVPTEVLRAWGWWASPFGTEVHYAAFVTGVMRAASALLHLVRVARLRPGFVEFLGLDDDLAVPRWSRMAAAVPGLAEDAPARPPRTRGSEVTDSSSDDQAVVVPRGLLDLRGEDRAAAAPFCLSLRPLAALPAAGLAPVAGQRSLLSSALVLVPRAGGAPAGCLQPDSPPRAGAGAAGAALAAQAAEARAASPSPRVVRASASQSTDPRVTPCPRLSAPRAPPRAVSRFGSALLGYSRGSGGPRAGPGGGSEPPLTEEERAMDTRVRPGEDDRSDYDGVDLGCGGYSQARGVGTAWGGSR